MDAAHCGGGPFQSACYTGRQVWNRQRTDRDPRHPTDALFGHDDVQRWNPTGQWVISAKVAHTPLVNEADFIATQKINAVPMPENGSTRTYLLAALLICRLCRRRMDAHWLHGRPGYRCRHGHTSAKPAAPGRLADVPDLAGAHTYARTLARLDEAVREVIAMVEDLPEGAEPDLSVTYDYRLGDAELDQLAADIRAERIRLARAERALAESTVQAATRLRERGTISARDAAVVLGVSRTWVSRLAPTKRATTTRRRQKRVAA